MMRSWWVTCLIVGGLLASACDQGGGSKPPVEDVAVDDAAVETSDQPIELPDLTPDTPPLDRDGDLFPDGEDCDDTNALVFPGANEYCNGIDDNCDGRIDEDTALDALTWYADRDGDGFGDPLSARSACAQPAGFVSNARDCDDTDIAIHPDAAELCNGADDDCDGEIDELGALGATSFFPDTDLDGYGDDAGEVLACAMPTGFTPFGGDCDDTDETVNPGSPELCNGVDDNCDGTIDEPTAIDAVTFYRDADGDNFGDRSDSVVACAPPTGYVANDSDCADDDSAIHPGVADLPDLLAVDANCDGIDGDLGLAVFVSVSTGDDSASGLGTRGSDGSLVVEAVRTLARAIEIADTCEPKCYVLLAEGTYDQGATPLSLREGVSLYGGYDTSWVRNRPIAATVITSSASPTVLASAITLDTVLELLTIQGPTMTGAGEHSLALLVRETPSADRLVLRAVELNAGRGGHGAVGTDGTTQACSCPGGTGGTSFNCGTTPGAQGGCSGGAGGAGGTSNCRSTCLITWVYTTDGASGTAGLDGAAPTTAGARSNNVLGTFQPSGHWVPSTATSGTAGANGAGGGGGGGGGWWQNYCAVNLCVYDFPGATGGQGGDGGCAGTAGGAGGQGGGAFGIVLVSSLLTIDTVGIRMGVGGDGGRGGNGGAGSVRTTGLAGELGYKNGVCGAIATELVNSGHGGAGGHGGHGSGGSGGGGGNGGPSIGIALVGITSRVDGDAPTPDPTGAQAGTLGVAGQGGLSGNSATRSPNGAHGLNGGIATIQNYP